MLKLFIHYGLHFIFPAIIAFLFFKEKWKTAYFIFILSTLVDLDHIIGKTNI
tara:strand:- start:992 stop:1147 length:156 start_codon:yes stop_codon:yes gene_type:complete